MHGDGNGDGGGAAAAVVVADDGNQQLRQHQRTTGRRLSAWLRAFCSFSNSTRDFSDSLTICNYNLPST